MCVFVCVGHVRARTSGTRKFRGAAAQHGGYFITCACVCVYVHTKHQGHCQVQVQCVSVLVCARPKITRPEAFSDRVQNIKPKCDTIRMIPHECNAVN